MKVLLIIPTSSYSLGKLLESSFAMNGHNVSVCNPEALVPQWKQRLNIQVFRLPYRFANHGKIPS